MPNRPLYFPTKETKKGDYIDLTWDTHLDVRPRIVSGQCPIPMYHPCGDTPHVYIYIYRYTGWWFGTFEIFCYSLGFH